MANLIAQLMWWPIEMFTAGLDLAATFLRNIANSAPQKLATQPVLPLEPMPGTTTNRGDIQSMDPDLSGDDLKLVRYRIILNKRDDEKILEPSKEELVNYSTTAADFGGLKAASSPAVANLPAIDRKYVTVMIELLSRQPKRGPEYERRQADALDKIAKSF